MEKVMPSFEYEPLVLSLEPETSNEEDKKGDTNGATPSSTRVAKDTSEEEKTALRVRMLNKFYNK
jgi:hypothetical protein